MVLCKYYEQCEMRRSLHSGSRQAAAAYEFSVCLGDLSAVRTCAYYQLMNRITALEDQLAIHTQTTQEDFTE